MVEGCLSFLSVSLSKKNLLVTIFSKVGIESFSCLNSAASLMILISVLPCLQSQMNLVATIHLITCSFCLSLPRLAMRTFAAGGAPGAHRFRDTLLETPVAWSSTHRTGGGKCFCVQRLAVSFCFGLARQAGERTSPNMSEYNSSQLPF